MKRRRFAPKVAFREGCPVSTTGIPIAAYGSAAEASFVYRFVYRGLKNESK
jgi:hypothetical protein